MTIRDPEVLETLRDEPELLALADAVSETQRLAGKSRRRVVSRWAVVVAVGAVAVLLAMLWPGGGGRSPILSRALAAIGNGPVLHLVLQVPAEGEYVNLRTGKTVVPTEEIESWSDQSLKRFHLIFREDGRLVGEVLLPQDGGATVGKADPAYAALWTGYREALSSGKAKIEGTGALYGHDVYWLGFPPGRDRLVAIDRSTYEPVAFRSTFPGGRHVDSRILLARTEPLSTAAFRRRMPKQASGGPVSSGGGSSVTESGPNLRLTKPWLQAGPAIAGLRLLSVRPYVETSAGRTAKGVELVYGSAEGFSHGITIDELQRPGDASEWQGIPAGSMRVTAGSESDGNGDAHTLWSGNAVIDGIRVRINTAVGRAALLEAARALRPA